MAYPLLFLCALIGWSQAFLPAPSLDIEGITHADITQEALLEVVMDACREEAQKEGQTFNPPALLTPDSLLRACLGVSEDADLSVSKFQELLNEIITENILIERDQASSAHHFNDEAIEKGRDIITQGVSIVKASLQQGDLEAARRALGAVTHTLQDFYSHSNWFELGNLDPYPNLLRPDLPLQNLADANTPTCNDCQEKVCPNVILPEILSTNTLTSGYLSFTPEGKCNHGDSTRGGISKDFFGDDLTPDGTDPHLAAFDFAVQATTDLLHDIRIAFGNTVFLRYTFLYPVVVGPVTSTTDPEEMKRAVNSLTTDGSRNIPTLFFSAMRLALITAPPSTDIFVFTNALPKDIELQDTVISLIESTRSTVTLFLTNALSRRRTRRRRRSALTNPTNSIYQQLAQLSGGQAIEVTKDTLSLATVVIEDSITSSLVTLLQVESTQPDTFSFLLDPRLQNVVLYITGLSINFTLQNPAGVSQDNTAGSGPLVSVFLVGNLYRVSLNEGNLTGRWQITIRSPQAYSLRVTGRSALNFMSQFIEEFGGPHPGFAPISTRPPAGQNATLLITVTGVDMLFGVEVGLVSADGELLRNTSATRLRDGTYLVRVPHLPDVPFTLLLMGQEADGRPFQRQSSTQIQASQIIVQVQRTVILAPGESVSVPFSVETREIEGIITISARDDQRFVTTVNNSLNVGAAGNTTGLVSLFVPAGTLSGITSVVTIEAESTATRQSNFALLRVFVMQKDMDVTPPVCRVVNESLDCPVPCGNATWEVTLLMTDGNGTGLRYPHISIIIPDSPGPPTAIIDQVMDVTRQLCCALNESLDCSVPCWAAKWEVLLFEDENGCIVILLTYRASGCETNESSALDNEGWSDFSIRQSSTSKNPSNSPRISASLWTAVPLIALTALKLYYMFSAGF
ncbi:hypothetical protein AOLI_G00064830 [Acnodon oligacanthus]